MAQKSFVNDKSCKAVAEVKTVFLFNHKDNGGVEPTVDANLFTAGSGQGALGDKWYSTLTLKGSVTAGQDAPSIEKINVDQYNQPIGMTSEPGDFNIEFNVPDFKKADLEQLLGKELTDSTVALDGKELYGLDLDGSFINCAVLIGTAGGDKILFPNVQLTITFMQDGKVFGFKATGQVLASSVPSQNFMYIAHEAPSVSEES